MDKNKRSRSSFIYNIKNKVKHGLFLATIQNLLVRFGIDIQPYLWALEGQENLEEPIIKGHDSNFEIAYLSTEEAIGIGTNLGWDINELKEDFSKGQKCLGLKNGKELSALMFVKFKNFEVKDRIFTLEPNEVYLSNMYTFEKYRGRNLAPYLRYFTYKLLKNEGINKIYSISDYFNTPSRKFKKKLKAKDLKLYVLIIFFKKYRKTFLIRNYK